MGFRITDKGFYIDVKLEGFVDACETRSHFAQLAKVLLVQRARLGLARIVVDTTKAQPQSDQVARLMSQTTATLYRETDRVALLVSSSLLRMQIRRVLNERPFPTFTDATEAEAYATS